MNSRYTPLLVVGLLLVGCESTREAGEAPAPVPSPTAEARPSADPVDLPEATEPTTSRPVPRDGTSGYAPEYHPEARGLLERMEGALKPLESVPSEPRADLM